MQQCSDGNTEHLAWSVQAQLRAQPQEAGADEAMPAAPAVHTIESVQHEAKRKRQTFDADQEATEQLPAGRGKPPRLLAQAIVSFSWQRRDFA